MTRWLDLIKRRPLILAWLVLSATMVAVLLWSARDAGLQPPQLAAVAAATVALAAACVWITAWE